MKKRLKKKLKKRLFCRKYSHVVDAKIEVHERREKLISEFNDWLLKSLSPTNRESKTIVFKRYENLDEKTTEEKTA